MASNDFTSVFLLDSQESKLRPQARQWDLGPMTTSQRGLRRQSLERWRLDVTAGAVRLEPGSAKNYDGRMVYVRSRRSDASRGHRRWGGHTRSVFDRYDMVRPGDLQDVARRLTDNSRRTGPAGGRADVSRNFSTSLTGRP
jgi:hypothetical protein